MFNEIFLFENFYLQSFVHFYRNFVEIIGLIAAEYYY